MSAPSSARKQGSGGASHVTKICQNGDIILAVGSKAKIQVASDFLKHISPVFKAMLDAPMSEGEALRNKSPDSPPITISLPDDDPAAMRRLLQILYGSDQLDLEFLEVYNVMFLANKYGMTTRLNNFGIYWMHLHLDEDEGKESYFEDCWKILVIAYMIDNVWYFFEISKKLSKSVRSMAGWALALPDPQLGFKLALAIEELRALNKTRKAINRFRKGLCLGCFQNVKDSFTSKQKGCETDDAYH